MKYVGRNDYYQFLKTHDVIEKVRFLLEQRGYWIRKEDGKITAEVRMDWNTPWHFVRNDGVTDCHLWNGVIFTCLGIVHSGCLDCWKVVVRPRTLKELFALLDLEIELDRSSKCGIEIRPAVNGLYGGYFYNRSFDEAVDCYKLVKARMEEDEILRDLIAQKDAMGVPSKLLLKRGCTEFELSAGRSDLWKIQDGQLEIEDLLEKHFVRLHSLEQPDFLLWHIHKTWIEWAYQHGDQTYLEFTNGESVFPKTLTYHQLVEIEGLRAQIERGPEAGSSLTK